MACCIQLLYTFPTVPIPTPPTHDIYWTLQFQHSSVKHGSYRHCVLRNQRNRCLNYCTISSSDVLEQITKFRYKTLDAQITTSARGIVVSAIYTKMLRLRTEDIDQSFLHTAIAQYLTDVEHLLQSAQDRIWAAAQIVAGALLLLCIAGIYSLFITVPISRKSPPRLPHQSMG